MKNGTKQTRTCSVLEAPMIALPSLRFRWNNVDRCGCDAMRCSLSFANLLLPLYDDDMTRRDKIVMVNGMEYKLSSTIDIEKERVAGS
mmetsp:Transcript_770/g.1781  ORF Transcript_770/g.1781 Transcript_770/m.1781 type:complete len:88 (-) Transcript_770:2-265(-)